jgi:hypothetical protein
MLKACFGRESRHGISPDSARSRARQRRALPQAETLESLCLLSAVPHGVALDAARIKLPVVVGAASDTLGIRAGLADTAGWTRPSSGRTDRPERAARGSLQNLNATRSIAYRMRSDRWSPPAGNRSITLPDLGSDGSAWLHPQLAALDTPPGMSANTRLGAKRSESKPGDVAPVDAPSVPPRLVAFAASPAAIAIGDVLTLNAEAAPAPAAPVARVLFYREADGLPGLNPATDTLVATDTDGSDGWSAEVATADAAPGEQAYYALAFDAAAVAAPDAPSASVLVRGIDLRTFGAVGDGITNDAPAVQAAARAAMAAGVPLYVPAGTFRLELPTGAVNVPTTLPAGPGTWLTVTAPLTIIGAGRDAARLVVEPSDPADVTGDMAVFMIRHDAREIGLTLRGLSIQGPAAPDVSFDRQPARNLVQHWGPRVDGGTSWLRVEDVAVTGRFTNAFFMDGGTVVRDTRVDWQIRNSSIEALSAAVACFSNPAASRFVHVQDCVIEAGIRDPLTGVGRGDAIYVHQSVSLLVERCAFLNNHRAAIKYAGVNAVGAGLYGIIRDCTFPGSTGIGIVVDKFLTTQIERCVFPDTLTTAVMHYGGLTMSDCEVRCTTVLAATGTSAIDPVITVQNCRLDGVSTVTEGNATDGWKGTLYRVIDSTIRTGPTLNRVLFQAPRADQVFEITGCLVESAVCKPAILANHGTWRLIGNTFRGTYDPKWGVFLIMKDYKDLRVEMAGNSFLQENCPVLYIYVSQSGGEIVGRDNQIRTGIRVAGKAPGVSYGQQDWRDKRGMPIDLDRC